MTEAERTIAGWLGRGWTVASDIWCPDDYVHPWDIGNGPILICNPVALANVKRTALAAFDRLVGT